MAQCTCDNCNWTGDEADLRFDITDCPDLNDRLEPGSVVPAGECPECGSFAYLVPNNPAVVLVGNPVDGLTIVGPFATLGHAIDWAGEACLWAGENCGTQWNAVSVQSVSQYEAS